MDKETNIRQAEVIIDGKQSSVKWKSKASCFSFLFFPHSNKNKK